MNLHRLDLVSRSLVSLVVRTRSSNRAAQLARLGSGCGCKRISDREGTVGAELFERSINLHAVPEKITVVNSGNNTAAVRELIADSGLDIEPRQSKYLNHFVEKDHRAIKWHVRTLL